MVAAFQNSHKNGVTEISAHVSVYKIPLQNVEFASMNLVAPPICN